MRRTAELCGLLALVVVIGGCGPAKQAKPADMDEEMLGSRIAEDWDEAERRWRKDIASQRWSEDDMNLLTDDPPQAPETYGKVADASNGGTLAVNDGAKSETAAAVAEPAADSNPGEDAEMIAGSNDPWDRSESRADKFNKATFAFLSVAATLGMMVAPYFLL